MTDVDEHGRPEPPVAGGEAETLQGFLDFQRATFKWKCSGLDEAGLRTKVAASSMTLGGMLKHLALVEDWWFSQGLLGREAAPPWNAVDFDADPDWEWRTGAEDSPDELRALWESATANSRAIVTDALKDGGLDQLISRKWPDGRAPSLRWLLVHMIEEYGRHNGHADLIREAVDGERGE